MNDEKLDYIIKNLKNHEEKVWFEKQKSIEQAWNKYHRGDLMLWLLGKNCKHNSLEHKKICLSACECSRSSLRFYSKNEKIPIRTIETMESFLKNDISIEKVIEVKEDIMKNSNIWEHSLSKYASVWYAINSIFDVMWAFNSSFFAAMYDKVILKRHADIVRKYFPIFPDIIKENCKIR